MKNQKSEESRIPSLKYIRIISKGTMSRQDVMEAAKEAQNEAYAPYSDYSVGAALETENGVIYTGCNREDMAFNGTVHAEVSALNESENFKNHFGMLSEQIDVAVEDLTDSMEAELESDKTYVRIAVATGSEWASPPCGHCRQVLAEHCGPELEVISEGKIPDGFGDEGVLDRSWADFFKRTEEGYALCYLGDIFPVAMQWVGKDI